MSSIDSRPAADTAPLPEQTRKLLLQLVHDSIAYGLTHGTPLPVRLEDYAEVLRESRATFVTLHIAGQLRGCIGMLEAIRPLVEDVAHNAYAAAFSDPRFPPVGKVELDRLEIEISILSPAVPLEFRSEEDLVGQLRPGVDGLILEDGFHRGTFLPTVWESLPEPREFLRQLKRKAGLSVDYWSPGIRVGRYTTESFG